MMSHIPLFYTNMVDRNGNEEDATELTFIVDATAGAAVDITIAITSIPRTKDLMLSFFIRISPFVLIDGFILLIILYNSQRPLVVFVVIWW